MVWKTPMQLFDQPNILWICLFCKDKGFLLFNKKKSHWTYKLWSLHCSHHIILTKKNILTFTCVFHLLSQNFLFYFQFETGLS